MNHKASGVRCCGGGAGNGGGGGGGACNEGVRRPLPVLLAGELGLEGHGRGPSGVRYPLLLPLFPQLIFDYCCLEPMGSATSFSVGFLTDGVVVIAAVALSVGFLADG